MFLSKHYLILGRPCVHALKHQYKQYPDYLHVLVLLLLLLLHRPANPEEGQLSEIGQRGEKLSQIFSKRGNATRKPVNVQDFN